MAWIDIGNPYPRDEPHPYEPIIWPVAGVKTLMVPHEFPGISFVETISSRRTRRIFGPVTDEDLSMLLWLSLHCQQKAESPFGFELEQRPVPSAGAIHPIHVLINSWKDPVWWRYLPGDHALAAVIDSQVILESLRQAITNVLPRQQGTALLFLAEPGKIFAKYGEGCSLIWRDAGVLLGHLCLVAEMLGLNLCPLGITGEPWASRLNQQSRLVGVGLALLGSRP